MEPICSYCDRTDIRSSDGDFHMCHVCHIESLLLSKFIAPKLREIAISIIEDNLFNK